MPADPTPQAATVVLPAAPDPGGQAGVPALTPSALAPSAVGQAALAAAAAYAKRALAPATCRAYQADWTHFFTWCAEANLAALPAAPATVGAYLAAMAPTHARASIRRRLAAIGQMHQLHGHDWTPSQPAIRAPLRGMLRSHGTPARRAAALGTAEIRRLVAACDASPAGEPVGTAGRRRAPGPAIRLAALRDRALLLLGYAAALRRAELAGVTWEELVFTADGALRVLIARAKGDPEGEGAWIGVPRGERRDTCPVLALEAWRTAAGRRHGPVFRKIDCWGRLGSAALHPDAVRQILRKRAAAAGLAVASVERLSPHGLRAGFVTEAYAAGARDEQIMAHTRHRDLKTMRGYVRRAKLGTESPAKLLGL
jgi:integrase